MLSIQRNKKWMAIKNDNKIALWTNSAFDNNNNSFDEKNNMELQIKLEEKKNYQIYSYHFISF